MKYLRISNDLSAMTGSGDCIGLKTIINFDRASAACHDIDKNTNYFALTF